MPSARSPSDKTSPCGASSSPRTVPAAVAVRRGTSSAGRHRMGDSPIRLSFERAEEGGDRGQTQAEGDAAQYVRGPVGAEDDAGEPDQDDAGDRERTDRAAARRR